MGLLQGFAGLLVADHLCAINSTEPKTIELVL
jgi:hypothetical protein